MPKKEWCRENFKKENSLCLQLKSKREEVAVWVVYKSSGLTIRMDMLILKIQDKSMHGEKKKKLSSELILKCLLRQTNGNAK